MICGGNGSEASSSSANSGPMKSPRVSGSMASRNWARLGRRSKVTGSALARSCSGAGSAARTAATSATARACSFAQSNFKVLTLQRFKVSPLAPRGLKQPEHLRTRFEKLRQVSHDFHRFRTQMMLDAFDVVALGFHIQPEQREKPGEC